MKTTPSLGVKEATKTKPRAVTHKKNVSKTKVQESRSNRTKKQVPRKKQEVQRPKKAQPVVKPSTTTSFFLNLGTMDYLSLAILSIAGISYAYSQGWFSSHSYVPQPVHKAPSINDPLLGDALKIPDIPGQQQGSLKVKEPGQQDVNKNNTIVEQGSYKSSSISGQQQGSLKVKESGQQDANKNNTIVGQGSYNSSSPVQDSGKGNGSLSGQGKWQISWPTILSVGASAVVGTGVSFIKRSFLQENGLQGLQTELPIALTLLAATPIMGPSLFGGYALKEFYSIQHKNRILCQEFHNVLNESKTWNKDSGAKYSQLSENPEKILQYINILTKDDLQNLNHDMIAVLSQNGKQVKPLQDKIDDLLSLEKAGALYGELSTKIKQQESILKLLNDGVGEELIEPTSISIITARNLSQDQLKKLKPEMIRQLSPGARKEILLRKDINMDKSAIEAIKEEQYRDIMEKDPEFSIPDKYINHLSFKKAPKLVDEAELRAGLERILQNNYDDLPYNPARYLEVMTDEQLQEITHENVWYFTQGENGLRFLKEKVNGSALEGNVKRELNEIINIREHIENFIKDQKHNLDPNYYQYMTLSDVSALPPSRFQEIPLSSLNNNVLNLVFETTPNMISKAQIVAHFRELNPEMIRHLSPGELKEILLTEDIKLDKSAIEAIKEEQYKDIIQKDPHFSIPDKYINHLSFEKAPKLVDEDELRAGLERILQNNYDDLPYNPARYLEVMTDEQLQEITHENVWYFTQGENGLRFLKEKVNGSALEGNVKRELNEIINIREHIENFIKDQKHNLDPNYYQYMTLSDVSALPPSRFQEIPLSSLNNNVLHLVFETKSNVISEDQIVGIPVERWERFAKKFKVPEAILGRCTPEQLMHILAPAESQNLFEDIPRDKKDDFGEYLARLNNQDDISAKNVFSKISEEKREEIVTKLKGKEKYLEKIKEIVERINIVTRDLEEPGRKSFFSSQSSEMIKAPIQNNKETRDLIRACSESNRRSIFLYTQRRERERMGAILFSESERKEIDSLGKILDGSITGADFKPDKLKDYRLWFINEDLQIDNFVNLGVLFAGQDGLDDLKDRLMNQAKPQFNVSVMERSAYVDGGKLEQLIAIRESIESFLKGEDRALNIEDEEYNNYKYLTWFDIKRIIEAGQINKVPLHLLNAEAFCAVFQNPHGVLSEKQIEDIPMDTWNNMCENPKFTVLQKDLEKCSPQKICSLIDSGKCYGMIDTLSHDKKTLIYGFLAALLYDGPGGSYSHKISPSERSAVNKELEIIRKKKEEDEARDREVMEEHERKKEEESRKRAEREKQREEESRKRAEEEERERRKRAEDAQNCAQLIIDKIKNQTKEQNERQVFFQGIAAEIEKAYQAFPKNKATINDFIKGRCSKSEKTAIYFFNKEKKFIFSDLFDYDGRVEIINLNDILEGSVSYLSPLEVTKCRAWFINDQLQYMDEKNERKDVDQMDLSHLFAGKDGLEDLKNRVSQHGLDASVKKKFQELIPIREKVELFLEGDNEALHADEEEEKNDYKYLTRFDIKRLITEGHITRVQLKFLNDKAFRTAFTESEGGLSLEQIQAIPDQVLDEKMLGKFKISDVDMNKCSPSQLQHLFSAGELIGRLCWITDPLLRGELCEYLAKMDMASRDTASRNSRFRLIYSKLSPDDQSLMRPYIEAEEKKNQTQSNLFQSFFPLQEPEGQPPMQSNANPAGFKEESRIEDAAELRKRNAQDRAQLIIDTIKNQPKGQNQRQVFFQGIAAEIEDVYKNFPENKTDINNFIINECSKSEKIAIYLFNKEKNSIFYNLFNGAERTEIRDLKDILEGKSREFSPQQVKSCRAWFTNDQLQYMDEKNALKDVDQIDLAVLFSGEDGLMDLKNRVNQPDLDVSVWKKFTELIPIREQIEQFHVSKGCNFYAWQEYYKNLTWLDIKRIIEAEQTHRLPLALLNKKAFRTAFEYSKGRLSQSQIQAIPMDVWQNVTDAFTTICKEDINKLSVPQLQHLFSIGKLTGKLNEITTLKKEFFEDIAHGINTEQNANFLACYNTLSYSEKNLIDSYIEADKKKNANQNHFSQSSFQKKKPEGQPLMQNNANSADFKGGRQIKPVGFKEEGGLEKASKDRMMITSEELEGILDKKFDTSFDFPTFPFPTRYFHTILEDDQLHRIDWENASILFSDNNVSSSAKYFRDAAISPEVKNKLKEVMDIRTNIEKLIENISRIDDKYIPFLTRFDIKRIYLRSGNGNMKMSPQQVSLLNFQSLYQIFVECNGNVSDVMLENVGQGKLAFLFCNSDLSERIPKDFFKRCRVLDMKSVDNDKEYLFDHLLAQSQLPGQENVLNFFQDVANDFMRNDGFTMNMVEKTREMEGSLQEREIVYYLMDKDSPMKNKLLDAGEKSPQKEALLTYLEKGELNNSILAKKPCPVLLKAYRAMLTDDDLRHINKENVSYLFQGEEGLKDLEARVELAKKNRTINDDLKTRLEKLVTEQKRSEDEEKLKRILEKKFDTSFDFPTFLFPTRYSHTMLKDDQLHRIDWENASILFSGQNMSNYEKHFNTAAIPPIVKEKLKEITDIRTNIEKLIENASGIDDKYIPFLTRFDIKRIYLRSGEKTIKMSPQQVSLLNFQSLYQILVECNGVPEVVLENVGQGKWAFLFSHSDLFEKKISKDFLERLRVSHIKAIYDNRRCVFEDLLFQSDLPGQENVLNFFQDIANDFMRNDGFTMNMVEKTREMEGSLQEREIVYYLMDKDSPMKNKLLDAGEKSPQKEALLTYLEKGELNNSILADKPCPVLLKAYRAMLTDDELRHINKKNVSYLFQGPDGLESLKARVELAKKNGTINDDLKKTLETLVTEQKHIEGSVPPVKGGKIHDGDKEGGHQMKGVGMKKMEE